VLRAKPSDIIIRIAHKIGYFLKGTTQAAKNELLASELHE
jgi:hypothetical protein